jgi:hypothetical protein
MTSMTAPVLPLPLYFTLGFAGPLLLVVGSTMLMAVWHTRFASILVLLACAWLTWGVAPASITGFIEAQQTLDAPKWYYFVLSALLLFVVLANTAAVLVFRRVRKTI